MPRKKHWRHRPTPRIAGSSPSSIVHRLTESTYQWNDRPCWEYAGAPRVVLGQDVDPRCFSARRIVRNPIIWGMDDQAWAVEQGFFVARELIRERPVIIGINRYDQTKFSYWEPYKTMREIERRVFLRVFNYDKLYAFIEQQDRWGCTGAWDKRVMCYAPELQWYKLYVTQGNGTFFQQNATKMGRLRAGQTRWRRAYGRQQEHAKWLDMSDPKYRGLSLNSLDRLAYKAKMEHARDGKHLKRVSAIILNNDPHQ